MPWGGSVGYGDAECGARFQRAKSLYAMQAGSDFVGMRASAGIVAGVTVVVVLLSWCQSAPAAEFRDPGPVRALPGPGDDTLLGDVFAYQYVIAATYGIALVVAVVLLALQEFLLRCRLNSHPDGQSDAVFRSVIPDETRTRRRT
ncbi:Uncharacterized protein PBTT_02087 [Plasmodiophora brassicae]